jgi:hypothetical protein
LGSTLDKDTTQSVGGTRGAQIYGLNIHNSADNMIGGVIPAARNLFSGNDLDGDEPTTLR